jgi:hypothetical protein
MRTYECSAINVVLAHELTSRRQADNLDDFAARFPSDVVYVARIDGDPRATRRKFRKQINKGDACVVGRSSGCASARGNYHSTVAFRCIQLLIHF